MAGNAASDSLTPDVALGLLQDALVSLQGVGQEVLANTITAPGGEPMLVLLLPGVVLREDEDGTVTLALVAAASTPTEALP